MTEISREISFHNLASKFAGGDKDGSREWRRALLEAVKAGTLEARIVKHPTPALVRRVGNGIASREWANEFSRPAQPRQGLSITSRYFTPAAVTAWLRLVKIEPPELVRAWLGDAWQSAAPKSTAKADTEPVRRKKAALINEVISRWPDIESDLRHADENGLRDTAKLEGHGDWNLTAAVEWAKERGKFTDSTSQELNPLEAFNRLSMSKRKQ